MERTITISEETYEKLKDQLTEEEVTELTDLDSLIGNKYFFRTVTYHLTGKVTGRIGNILTLKDAAWIADSGRFMDAIKSGELNEVEPVGVAYINLSTVVDFFPWKHQLPKEQR